MRRTSDKNHGGSLFDAADVANTFRQATFPNTDATTSGGGLVLDDLQQAAETPDWSGSMRKRNPAPYTPGVIEVAPTAASLRSLDAALKSADLTWVLVSLAADPDVARTRAYLAEVVRRFRGAKPHLPDPVFVGLHAVDPGKRGALQRELTIPGVGGFAADGVDRFAERFGGTVVVPQASEPWTSRAGDRTDASRRR